MLGDYFQSSQYIDATHKKFHIIHLDEHDHDAMSIKLTKTHKFKPVESLSKCQILTREIAKNVELTNKIAIDSVMKEAFHEMLELDGFFKFQEVRTEFIVSISPVKNRKVFKKINVNIGCFTLIVGSKPYDYQEGDSKHKKPQDCLYLTRSIRSMMLSLWLCSTTVKSIIAMRAEMLRI